MQYFRLHHILNSRVYLVAPSYCSTQEKKGKLFSSCNQGLRRSAKSLVVEVDPTRLELVTSAMRSQYDSLPELSGGCKIPANEHICCVMPFSRFQDIYSGLLHGCCTSWSSDPSEYTRMSSRGN